MKKTTAIIVALLTSASLAACTPEAAPTASPAPTTSTSAPAPAPVPTTAPTTTEDLVDPAEVDIPAYDAPVNPVPILRSLEGVTPVPGTAEGETTPEGDRTASGHILNENGNPSVSVEVRTFPANVPVEVALPEAVDPVPSDMEHYITAKGVVIHVVDTTMTTVTKKDLSKWAAAVHGKVS